MADQMTSIDVIGRRYQQRYHPEEQAQEYPINVYLFRMGNKLYLYSG